CSRRARAWRRASRSARNAPGGKAKHPPGLLEFRRNRTQRLIEAEGHVPGLAREDREDRREFRTKNSSWREREKEKIGDGQVTKDRYGLQNVEYRNEQRACARALRGPGRIGECEDERNEEAGQHPQRRA